VAPLEAMPSGGGSHRKRGEKCSGSYVSGEMREEAAIFGDWTFTDGLGGGEGPWRALNAEGEGAEKKNH
jgi:hypothetical protein